MPIKMATIFQKATIKKMIKQKNTKLVRVNSSCVRAEEQIKPTFPSVSPNSLRSFSDNELNPDISAIRTAASTISKDGATGNVPVFFLFFVVCGFCVFISLLLLA